MPINYRDYPPDWNERRERIMHRANQCCEFCGIPNYTAKTDGTTVILTIAHLDHDVENWEVSDDRLAALCQKHHLGYDRWRHAENFKYGRNFRRYQPMLFDPQVCRLQLSVEQLRAVVYSREQYAYKPEVQCIDRPIQLALFNQATLKIIYNG